MKRCPECRRDYHDDSLSYCLEDGAALVQGSLSSPDEPRTAILHDATAASEAATRAQIHATDIDPGSVPDPFPSNVGFSERSGRKWLLVGLIVIVAVIGGLFAYRYFVPVSARQI